MLTRLALTAVLCLSVSYGAPIVASGAGPLPASAENLSAVYPTTITGSLAFPDGVNMFEIKILNYLDFSAITVPVGAHAVPDTELFLFDSKGLGVYGSDDISGSNTLSCLPSADASNPCGYGRSGVGPAANGIYYLAITRSANGPVSNLGEIFPNLVIGGVAGPDNTAGGGAPVNGWDGGVFTETDFDNVGYQINLTGTVPEPTSWALMGAAGLVLLFVRRKFAVQ